MKKLILTTAVILLSLNVANAAAPVYLPDEVLQGSTFKIEIPKFETTQISGSFDGRQIKFFEISKKPNWNEPITRAEFLKLLIDNHILELPSVPSIEFPDVPIGHPYYFYIKEAQTRGIIHGYEDGTFGPYDKITRAQAAKVLTLAFRPPSLIPYDEIPEFSDVANDDWYWSHIANAVSAKYLQGYPDGTMKPNRPINFDETEILIKRAAVPQEFIGPDSRAYYQGYVGVHRLTDPGLKILKIITDSNHDYPINVIKREVPVESFYLEPSKNELFASDKIDNTWQLINNAKANPNHEKIWEGEFAVPTEGIVTLGFGDKLYINGSFAGSHFGIDYANEEGTPVHASNSGIVTLAEETMSYGNTIIIDHGRNIFTMYLHCSELKVEKGDKVNKGDLIALMGSTGIATGSHLHFTVFVGDVIVDNNDWYEGKF
jgi:murein DD-endopeptidase MepM/ murein hydrolase activator NlpD